MDEAKIEQMEASTRGKKSAADTFERPNGRAQSEEGEHERQLEDTSREADESAQ